MVWWYGRTLKRRRIKLHNQENYNLIRQSWFGAGLATRNKNQARVLWTSKILWQKEWFNLCSKYIEQLANLKLLFAAQIRMHSVELHFSMCDFGCDIMNFMDSSKLAFDWGFYLNLTFNSFGCESTGFDNLASLHIFILTVQYCILCSCSNSRFNSNSTNKRHLLWHIKTAAPVNMRKPMNEYYWTLAYL